MLKSAQKGSVMADFLAVVTMATAIAAGLYFTGSVTIDGGGNKAGRYEGQGPHIKPMSQ